MAAALISTATMPGDDMSPVLIEVAATDFRSVGSKVSTRGGQVLTQWQKITAVYEAPESDTLTGAMQPVRTKAAAYGSDMAAAARALDAFAESVRTIKAEVAKIRADAAAFLGGIEDGKVGHLSYGGGDYYTESIDWHADQASVDANNALIRRTNDQQEALEAAERVCANAIRAAVGLGPIGPRTAANPTGFGLPEIPDDAPMPWGAAGERTESCLEKMAEGFVVDGGGGVLAGLGGLAGITHTGSAGFDWSRSTAGESWLGLLTFAAGAATFSIRA